MSGGCWKKAGKDRERKPFSMTFWNGKIFENHAKAIQVDPNVLWEPFYPLKKLHVTKKESIDLSNVTKSFYLLRNCICEPNVYFEGNVKNFFCHT